MAYHGGNVEKGFPLKTVPCKKCGKPTQTRSRSGVATCDECQTPEQRWRNAWRLAHPEKTKEYNRRHYEKTRPAPMSDEDKFPPRCVPCAGGCGAEVITRARRSDVYCPACRKARRREKEAAKRGPGPGRVKKGDTREPWEHVCACGKTFLSASYTALYCPACRKAARRRVLKAYQESPKGREKNRRARKRYSEAHPERVKESHDNWNRTKGAAWREKNKERHTLLARLRRHAEKGDKKALFEHGRLTGALKTCQRLHLSAFELPCGQHDACWGKTPCEFTAGLTREPAKRGSFF